MGKAFALTPQSVPRVETRFRRIVTALPVPESLTLLGTMRRCEPASMLGQPPVVWDRAEGAQVYDRHGTVKICPPLTISRDAVEDGLGALAEAIAEARR